MRTKRPDKEKESTNPMDELHAIRTKQYEESRHLSFKEVVQRINQRAEESKQDYQLKVKSLTHAA